MFGGSPFSAGAWAFGGRSSRAANPTVRMLIGDGWPSGARVQLEFPYTFRSGRGRAPLLLLLRGEGVCVWLGKRVERVGGRA